MQDYTSLGNLRIHRGWSSGHKIAQRRLHSPLPEPTKLVKVTYHHKRVCTRITRKGDPHPKVTPPAPKVQASGIMCTIKRRVGHSGEHTARETWFLPEGKLHINYMELKAVFSAPKEFQVLCLNQIIIMATDNTTVVAYINKESLESIKKASLKQV